MTWTASRRLPLLLLVGTVAMAGCGLKPDVQDRLAAGGFAGSSGDVGIGSGAVADGALGQVVDPETGQVIDASTGQVIDPATGQILAGPDGTATSSGPAAGPSVGPASRAAGPAGASGAVGPGVTEKEIKIGITLFKVGSFGEQIGSDLSYGEGERQAQAVVDYVNSTGGIAGRTVKPVYYTVDFGRAGSVGDGQFEAEACAKWTEDDKVFAALNNAMARQQLLPCLAKKGVPGIHDAMPIDEKRLAPFRDFYYSAVGSASLTIDRSASVQTQVFGQRGWYTATDPAKPTVVGIIHYDDEFYAGVVDKQMKPLLKSFGVNKVVVQAAPRGFTTPDATYIARFQSEGVTHVQFLGEANAYPMTFMPAAESQLYRPKYGLTSDQGPGILLQGMPPEQLKNSIGVGWAPLVDVDNAHDPGPVGPNNTLCFDIQTKAGQNMSERGAALTAATYCNGLFFLQKAMAAAPSVTAAGLAQAVSVFGAGYDSPGTFNPTSFSASKHDGASTYRDLAYRDGAFGYTSGNKPMP